MSAGSIRLAYVLLWTAALAYYGQARSSRRWIGWAATGILTLSWTLLTTGLVQRALIAGHWPLTNGYEFALCFAWAIVGVFLLLEATWFRPEFLIRAQRAEQVQPAGRLRGVFVLAVALLVAMYASLRPLDEQAITPLLPALRSAWLQLHVLSTLIGYGACGVAAGLALAQLLRPRSRSPDKAAANEEARATGVKAEIERTMERILMLGFPWLTLGLLTGAIWAQQAWGRYWGWDPKETWALVTWLWYLLILHLHPLRRWRGQRLAGLTVIGFGLILFTFVGVPWLVRTVRLESLHGF